MALTRAMLKGMGLTEEQIGAIIEEHTNVTTSLKDQIKTYKADAEKLADVQKELDDLKKDTSANDWQDKYEKEHKAFDDYKKDLAAKEKTAKVKAAYRTLLTEEKVGEKHIESILKVTDFSQMSLDDKGNLVDADKLKKSIKDEWGGFIPTTETQGAGPDNPPENNGGGKPAGQLSRAAMLARNYHNNLYGKVKEN